MTRPAWRTAYTPGQWLALTGPSTLVIMAPPPARAAATVNELWLNVVSAGSLDALLKLVAEVGLDAMPDLGAFHWDDDGLHGIARGRVRVVDTDTSEVVIDGEGAVTWREESLGRTRNLGITLEEFDPEEALQLPLVVGAASISAIYLTTDPAALVRFAPDAEAGAGAQAEAEVADGHDAAPAVVMPESPDEADFGHTEEDSGGEVRYDAFDTDDEAFDEGEPSLSTELSPADAPAEESPADLADDADEAAPDPQEEVSFVEELPDSGADDAEESEPDTQHPEFAEPRVAQTLEAGPEEIAAALAGVPAGLRGVPAPPPVAPGAPAPSEGPSSMSSPGSDRSDPIVIPPSLGEVDDDDGGTIFSTGLAATHKPAPPAGERPDPQVLAVPCTNGHANAPGSRTCRICQYPVDSSNARLIRRPTLAGVHTNRGDFADIVAGVIVGRAPDASKGPAGSYLMRVSSPGNDISRNHVLITTRDWNVYVTDLNSTNGTTVLPDGEAPFTLRDGASVQVGIGTVLDLGDGVSLRIEPPRG